MNRAATRTILLVASFALQGCYPAAPEPQGKSHLPIPSLKVELTPPIIQDDLSGIEGLKRACQNTKGAYFVKPSLECFCYYQKGERPPVFSMSNGGSCAPIRYNHAQANNSCTGKSFTESYLQGWIPALNECLSGVAGGHRTTLSVELSKVPGKDALNLARYADHHLEDIFVKLWPTFEDYFFNSAIKFLVGKAQVSRSFIEEIIAPPALTTQQRYRITFIEPEVGWVLHSLGHPQSQLPRLAAAPSSVVQRYPAANLIPKLISEVRAGFIGKAVSAIGDCRTSCVIEQHLDSKGFGLEAIRTKSYLGGVPFRDVVTIEDRAKDPVAVLQLNPSGGVSSVMLWDRYYDAGTDSLIADVEVFDRLWNQIGKERIEIARQLSKAADAVWDVRIASPDSQNGVVLCEAVDLEAFEKADLFQALRRRATPFSIEELRGSLFGWLPNPKGGTQFVDPIAEVQEGILPSFDAPTHGLRVGATLLAENPNAVLFPISTPNCVKRYNEWAPLIARHGVRVISFSATEPMDKRACEAKIPKEIFSQAMTFLWVTAAGNQGVTSPVLRCPQRLGPRENLIIVAGSRGDGLWEHSDRGVEYADIAADVGNPISNDLGTSYSAARVSATAAALARLFPSLTPEDIRLAILIGAQVPWNPIEVRSGGHLNAELAEAVAWELSRLPAPQRKNPDAFLARSLLQPYLNEYEVARRLQIWKERRLIP